MSTAQLDTVVRRLRGLIDGPAEASDRQLLDDFAARRDEAAFAELVRRHGPLVLGVCRRALRHQQDAEDAFQATFLVLARSARSIRNREVLSSWLHGVSRRIAMKAKRDAARRRAREDRARPATTSNPPGDLAWREVQVILDEGIERLPAHYRAPFLLCCLQGKGRLEAAADLGLKEGTLSSRLAKARRLLQEWLARRGVSLAAMLGVCALDHGSAVSAPLAQGTARAAALSVSGSTVGQVPPHILSWADAAARGFSRTKVAGVLALLVGLCAAGAVALVQQPVAAQPTAQPAKPDASKAAKAVPGAKAQEFEIAGRVLDPDGKPAASASVYLWTNNLKKRADVTVEATAGEDGSFRLRVPDAALKRDAKLVAGGVQGCAANWEDLRAAPKGAIILRLVKDDVPLSGRVLDLEGRPIPGVTVDVHWVGQHPAGQVGKWIDRFVEMMSKGTWINENGLRIVRPEMLDVGPVVTDQKGMFTIPGVGRDRVVTALLRGDAVETWRVQIAARLGRQAGEPWVKGMHGLYPTGADYMLGPTKPIIGTVRDRKTGKPVAGVTVFDQSFFVQSTTDAEGRYRLVGGPKRNQYSIGAGGKKGVPYIDFYRHDVADTPGLEPIRFDIEMERGVEISGKITDQATGQPVRGTVSYFHTRDNPNLKDFVTLQGPKMIASDWGRIGPDATFTVLGIPGPGALAVCAEDSSRYTRVKANEGLAKLNVSGGPVAPTHAVVKVDAAEDDPKTLRYDVALTQGVARQGTAAGEDGKPVPGVRVAGLDSAEEPRALKDGTFRITGLRPDQTWALVFLHEEKKLGALAEVRGESEKPLTIRLEALGAVMGRLVDDDGKPLPGRKVAAFLDVKGKGYENLPLGNVPFGATFGIDRRPWDRFTSRRSTADQDGRFRIEGLLPGQHYHVVASDEEVRHGRAVSHQANGVSVEAGKTKDLGDIRPHSKQEKEE
jgi:RNA polymerase sigma factor (sigma-70 family)